MLSSNPLQIGHWKSSYTSRTGEVAVPTGTPPSLFTPAGIEAEGFEGVRLAAHTATPAMMTTANTATIMMVRVRRLAACWVAT